MEVGENFKRAKHMFPQAVALEDLDKVIEQLKSGDISVPDNDLLLAQAFALDLKSMDASGAHLAGGGELSRWGATHRRGRSRPFPRT